MSLKLEDPSVAFAVARAAFRALCGAASAVLATCVASLVLVAKLAPIASVAGVASAPFLAGGCASVLLRPSFPPAVIPPRPRPSDWPDVGIAVVEDVATLVYEVSDDGDGAPPMNVVATLNHRRRLKILSEAGLGAATVRLHADEQSVIGDIAGRTVSPDGRETFLDPGTVEMRPWRPSDGPNQRIGGLLSTDPSGDPAQRATDTDAGASADADDAIDDGVPQILRFTIPGATIGGLIEYRYRRVYRDPNSIPPWVFGSAKGPVSRSEFGIVATPDIKIDYRYGRGGKLQEVHPMRRPYDGGRERMLFVERDLPAYYPEPRMPDLTHVAPWVAFTVTAAPPPDDSTPTTPISPSRGLATWDDVAARIRAWADAIGTVDLQGSVEERYNHVRDRARPVDTGGLGAMRPLAAAAVLKGLPAAPRDIALTLRAGLEGTGLDAHIALISAVGGPMLCEDLPALYPFARAVVAVTGAAAAKVARAAGGSCDGAVAERHPICGAVEAATGGEGWVFLDPSCKTCRMGELPLALGGGRGLVLLPEEQRWVDVPSAHPAFNQFSIQASLKIDLDGALRGEVDATWKGTPAQRVRRALWGWGAADGGGSGGGSGGGLLLREIYGEAAPEGVVVQEFAGGERPVMGPVTMGARLSANLPRDRGADERYRFRPGAVFGATLHGQWRSSRRHAAIVDGPQWHETRARIELPLGYRAEPLPTVRLANAIAEYGAGFQQRGTTLHYARRFVLKRRHIGASEWTQFSDLLEQIRDVEATGIVLFAATEEDPSAFRAPAFPPRRGRSVARMGRRERPLLRQGSAHPLR